MSSGLQLRCSSGNGHAEPADAVGEPSAERVQGCPRDALALVSLVEIQHDLDPSAWLLKDHPVEALAAAVGAHHDGLVGLRGLRAHGVEGEGPVLVPYDVELHPVPLLDHESVPVDPGGRHVGLHAAQPPVVEGAGDVIHAGTLLPSVALPSLLWVGLGLQRYGELRAHNPELHRHELLGRAAHEEALARASLVGAQDDDGSVLRLRLSWVNDLVVVPVAHDLELLRARSADVEARPVDPRPVLDARGHLPRLPLEAGDEDVVPVPEVGADDLVGDPAADRLPAHRLVLLVPPEDDAVEGSGTYPVRAAIDHPLHAGAVLVWPQDPHGGVRGARGRVERHVVVPVHEEPELLRLGEAEGDDADVGPVLRALHLVLVAPAVPGAGYVDAVPGVPGEAVLHELAVVVRAAVAVAAVLVVRELVADQGAAVLDLHGRRRDRRAAEPAHVAQAAGAGHNREVDLGDLALLGAPEARLHAAVHLAARVRAAVPEGRDPAVHAGHREVQQLSLEELREAS
mmetsp:Transcript_16368/g.46738  ORF Transcript_16368/g.46738 Transcript_16368/m.46738 type:complete len:514 (+) Transcript_16368:39-1580(+)